MAAPNPYPLGILSKFYQLVIGAVDKKVPAKLRPLWEHPAGNKYTILVIYNL